MLDVGCKKPKFQFSSISFSHFRSFSLAFFFLHYSSLNTNSFLPDIQYFGCWYYWPNFYSAILMRLEVLKFSPFSMIIIRYVIHNPQLVAVLNSNFAQQTDCCRWHGYCNIIKLFTVPSRLNEVETCSTLERNLHFVMPHWHEMKTWGHELYTLKSKH
jgi:hypothetical protein